MYDNISFQRFKSKIQKKFIFLFEKIQISDFQLDKLRKISYLCTKYYISIFL